MHELAHIITKSIGHTDEYWNNYKLILKQQLIIIYMNTKIIMKNQLNIVEKNYKYTIYNWR